MSETSPEVAKPPKKKPGPKPKVKPESKALPPGGEFHGSDGGASHEERQGHRKSWSELRLKAIDDAYLAGRLPASAAGVLAGQSYDPTDSLLMEDPNVIPGIEPLPVRRVKSFRVLHPITVLGGAYNNLTADAKTTIELDKDFPGGGLLVRRGDKVVTVPAVNIEVIEWIEL